MSAQPESRPLTADEYLEIDRAAVDEKFEFIDGDIVSMAGGSLMHSFIASNILLALGSQLRGKPCRVVGSDLRVQIEREGRYCYPDLVVVCGEPELRDDRRDTLVNPTVLIEVLSPSTELNDRGDKLTRYRRLPSVTDYLLVAQDRMQIEHYTRAEGRLWTLAEADGPDDGLVIASIGCTLRLADVYDRVTFPPPPDNLPELLG